jgi:hypothetical protein
MKVNKTVSLDIECATWLEGKNASALINMVISEALEKERKERLNIDVRTKCVMCGALNMKHIRTCGGCGRPVNKDDEVQLDEAQKV